MNRIRFSSLTQNERKKTCPYHRRRPGHSIFKLDGRVHYRSQPSSAPGKGNRPPSRMVGVGDSCQNRRRPALPELYSVPHLHQLRFQRISFHRRNPLILEISSPSPNRHLLVHDQFGVVFSLGSRQSLRMVGHPVAVDFHVACPADCPPLRLRELPGLVGRPAQLDQEGLLVNVFGSIWA